MKNKVARILWCIIILSITLTACRNSKSPQKVVVGQKIYELNQENQIIYDGIYTYEYEFSGDLSSYSLEIIYPNGATYHWSGGESGGHGGWSDDYEQGLRTYEDGDTLRAVLLEKAPESLEPKNVVFIFILIVLGALNILFPEKAWYLGYGWRFKNAEPSENALGFQRIGGGIAIIIGVWMIY